jgi:hypothetical protein
MREKTAPALDLGPLSASWSWELGFQVVADLVEPGAGVPQGREVCLVIQATVLGSSIIPMGSLLRHLLPSSGRSRDQ